jgi:hypothetical protein
MIGDPQLERMNETMWVHEIESLNIAEEARVEEVSTIARMVRQSLINLFGLNLMPLEDPETKKLVKMKEGEFVPLVVFTGREEIMKVASERQADLQSQEEVEEELGKEAIGEEHIMSPEELDEFIEGDIEFDGDWESLEQKAMWESPETQNFLKNNVLPLDQLAEMQKAMGLNIGALPQKEEDISEEDIPDEAPEKPEESETKPDQSDIDLERFKFTIDDD